jgi:signal transduction histidine kinase/ActR/RegA family two-component response regulator
MFQSGKINKNTTQQAQLDRFGWEFFPPIAAIVLLGILSFFSLRSIRQSEVRAEQSNRALAAIEQLLRDLLNAETGQRGYLLTGDLAYLEPYYQARGNYSRHIGEAEQLIQLPDALVTLAEVRDLATTKFEQWGQAIQWRATGEEEKALALLTSVETKQTTDAIRDRIVAVEIAIKAEVTDSSQRAAAAYFNAVLTFAAALVMTLTATVWSLLRVDHELQRRRWSEQVIRQRTGQLQSFADVVARIFSARDIESITGIALNEFRQLLGAREALLRLQDSQGLRYERGVVATEVQQPTAEYLDGVFKLVETVSRGESTFFRKREELDASEDITSSPLWALCGDSLDGVLSAPLRDSGRREVGRIVLMGKFGEDFSEHDRLLISQLAYSVSVAIDNAKLTAAMEHEANRKDEFLAMLGHELRNPLAGVLTGAQAMMQLNSDDPDAQALKASILRQSQMMGRIVDDLLDVSRIARGKITLAITDVDLKHLITQTVDDYRRHYPEREFKISISPSRDSYTVLGDPTRITQCVSNLLHNACKFSPEHTPVVVNLDAEPSGRPLAKIDIIDQGIGLSVVEQNMVCDPFRQTHTTIDRSQGGLGIGLTLAKGLIEMHGGELTVTSPGQGLGSTFTIRLPLRMQPANVPDSERNASPDARRLAQVANNHHSSAEPPVKQHRVLVIDDRLDAILPIRVILKRDGHEVFEAHDGPSGFQKAIELMPDLILCDIGLPGKWNGYDVVRELRQHPRTRDTYIVALSGYSQPADRQRAQEAGFNLHLAKPIDGARLRDLIRNRRRFDGLDAVTKLDDVSASHTTADQADHK